MSDSTSREPGGTPPRIEWSVEGIPFAPDYGDVYCSRSGLEQGSEVYVAGNRLPERLASGETVRVLETGLGLGLNLVATLRAWAAAGSGALGYGGIELHPVPPAELAAIYGRLGLEDEAASAFLGAYSELLKCGSASIRMGDQVCSARLVVGDGAAALARLEGPFDAVYLDGFMPAHNEAMWTPEVFREVARLTRPGGTVATYTSVGAVRRGVRDAGFEFARAEGFGPKRHCLLGRRLGCDTSTG